MQICIQQDNAKPHLNPYEAEIKKECAKDRWNIRLDCQPPNSPDFNVLDLGFFTSIQSLQHQSCPTNTNDLIKSVEDAFYAQPVEKVNFIF